MCSSDLADPTRVASINFTLGSNEALDASTVTASDFTVTNGSAPSISCTSSSCTVTTTAAAEGVVSITVSPTFSVSDVAGNATVGATILADTQVTYDRAVTYDITAPTLTLEQAADQADPAKNASIKFTLTANEPLDGTTVTASDFSVMNATGTTVSGSGATYTITATASGQGAVTIAPAAGFSVSDVAGNAQTTAGGTDRSVTFDSIAPTVTLAQAGGQSDPTKTAAITFSFTSSEALDAATVTQIGRAHV